MRNQFRLILLFIDCLSLISVAHGQRFLRDGFSSSLNEEFKYEMDTEDTAGDGSGSGAGGPVGMPRELFLLQGMTERLRLQLEPPTSLEIPGNVPLTQHLKKFLAKGPLRLDLQYRRGKRGFRAFAITPDGKRLRGSWYRGSGAGAGGGGIPTLLNKEFMTLSYDQAVRSRLSIVEMEFMLPKLKATNKVPRVVYQLAVEGGLMNPKAILPRGDGLVQVYPDYKATGPANVSTIGPSKLAWCLRPGIVDPAWARGRTILRQGRPTGQI